MQCPNCEKEYKKGTICPACNMDEVLFTGTVRLSDKLYNKGLVKLNNGDLTQGIELLTRSVAVNKNNVPARNLLGLALFEIGYVGDALKHWVISQSLLKENNPAHQYVEEARKNSRALESLNDSVVKYNQALTYLKQKSDDLAIIQLKRAVELNPRFVDALNLLALCHLIQNDRDKAAAAAERVLAVDIQNTVALNYLSIIAPNRAKQDTRKAQSRTGARQPSSCRRSTGYSRPAPVHEKRPRTFRFDIILALVLGAACSFAVVYILVFPTIHRQNEQQLQELRNDLAAASDARDEATLQHLAAIAEIEEGLGEQQDEIDRHLAELDRQDNIIRFHQVESLYRDGQLRESIDSLEHIDILGLPPDLRVRASEMQDAIYPVLFIQYRDAGIAASNASDYPLAMVQFENALRFETEESPRTATFLFALASLYEMDEVRHPEARELITELRERFPNYRPWARDQLLASLTDEE